VSSATARRALAAAAKTRERGQLALNALPGHQVESALKQLSDYATLPAIKLFDPRALTRESRCKQILAGNFCTYQASVMQSPAQLKTLGLQQLARRVTENLVVAAKRTAKANLRICLIADLQSLRVPHGLTIRTS
jgi:hypothetical protein